MLLGLVSDCGLIINLLQYETFESSTDSLLVHAVCGWLEHSREMYSPV